MSTTGCNRSHVLLVQQKIAHSMMGPSSKPRLAGMLLDSIEQVGYKQLHQKSWQHKKRPS